MTEDYGIVRVPKKVIQMIEGRLPQTDFKSVDEYVAFVLEEVIKEVSGNEPEAVYSEEDEEKVKERLRALGYLD